MERTDEEIIYLNTEDFLKKYPFITRNVLKNILFKNIGNFRELIVRKIGRLMFFDEKRFILYMKNNEGNVHENYDYTLNLKNKKMIK